MKMVCFMLWEIVQACDVLGKPQRSLAYLLQLYCGVSTNKIYQVQAIYSLFSAMIPKSISLYVFKDNFSVCGSSLQHFVRTKPY